MGGQEHFYMETQSMLVVPKGEDQEMDVYVSTQFPKYIQVTWGHCGEDMAKWFPASEIYQEQLEMKVYLGGWGGEIAWTQELKASVSCDHPLHSSPGDSETLSLTQNEQNKTKNVISSGTEEILSTNSHIDLGINSHMSSMLLKECY